jgi:hypothetical protein
MSHPRLPLVVLPDALAVCRLAADAPLPAWAAEGAPAFVSVTRTRGELSVVCPQERVPSGVRCERDYRALEVRGPLPVDLVGIFASLAAPLADAGLSIFPIATFDTDYVLVKDADLPRALEALRGAGHEVSSTPTSLPSRPR